MSKVKQTAQKAKHAASTSHPTKIEEDNFILDQFEEEENMMENPAGSRSFVEPRRKRTSEQVRQERQKRQKYLEKTKLEPGVINSNILTKSVSQSRVPQGMPKGSYLTTMPARNAPKSAWYK
ncbi:hypothetical protein RHSIM_Rhsim11G0004000 [Rhododendron simsii]|uniref:Uncharacterized protein n=1 Tax=Rhododendron simsii TaxID=118357 RepID=A0A834G6Y3_RHOSS|nr:hypothetical protein RHSIM_Rhsim11G0004000 [Rhododendron simsii]